MTEHLDPQHALNRRRAARASFDKEVTIKPVRRTNSKGFVRNVSEGGLYFLSPVYYPAGTEILFYLPFVENDRNLLCIVSGKVVRFDPKNEFSIHGHGIQFDEDVSYATKRMLQNYVSYENEPTRPEKQIRLQKVPVETRTVAEEAQDIETSVHEVKTVRMDISTERSVPEKSVPEKSSPERSAPRREITRSRPEVSIPTRDLTTGSRRARHTRKDLTTASRRISQRRTQKKRKIALRWGAVLLVVGLIAGKVVYGIVTERLWYNGLSKIVPMTRTRVVRQILRAEAESEWVEHTKRADKREHLRLLAEKLREKKIYQMVLVDYEGRKVAMILKNRSDRDKPEIQIYQ